jgi:predicted nucleic acid-binding protein
MWTVDTCVLIDIASADPKFSKFSAECLREYLRQGLVICPVTLVELGPVFSGKIPELRKFLNGCGINFTQPFSWQDAETAQALWTDFVIAKRNKTMPKRPVADVMIGAFALGTEGLITRNPKDFIRYIPQLTVVVPE